MPITLSDGRKIGRPTQITFRNVRIIYRAIMYGNSIRAASLLAKLNPNTVYRWQREGEDHDNLCELDQSECDLNCGVTAAARRLSINLKRAQSFAHNYHVKNIRKHAKKEWTASAWMLERTNPAEFGKQVEIHNSGTVRHVHVVKSLDNTDRKRIAEALLMQVQLDDSLPLLKQENGTYELGAGSPVSTEED